MRCAFCIGLRSGPMWLRQPTWAMASRPRPQVYKDTGVEKTDGEAGAGRRKSRCQENQRQPNPITGRCLAAMQDVTGSVPATSRLLH
jgi:hypothetical protein